MRHVVEYHVEPIPRSLMAAFVAAHPYAVRVRLRMCAAVLLNRRAKPNPKVLYRSGPCRAVKDLS
jgi:hypothetical protein